jgi:hypothetical protein
MPGHNVLLVNGRLVDPTANDAFATFEALRAEVCVRARSSSPVGVHTDRDVLVCARARSQQRQSHCAKCI